MGTHPIFESDFDCLTDCSKMAQGKKLLNKNKKSKTQGSVKKQLGKTKKGLKKQVKPRKADQIISKSVQQNLTKTINRTIERECLTQAGKQGTSLKVIKAIKTDVNGREINLEE